MVKFRLLFDKDEEVRWLNEMANKGWGFKKFVLGFISLNSVKNLNTSMILIY